MKDEILQTMLKEFSFFHEQFNLIQEQFNLVQEQLNQTRLESNNIRSELKMDINEIKSEIRIQDGKVGECVQILRDLSSFNYLTENDLKRFAKANNLEFKYS